LISKKEKTQLNLWIPADWKILLKRIARQKSLEEDKDISYLDLTKDLIWKNYISGSFQENIGENGAD